jgi:hypothetical protein
MIIALWSFAILRGSRTASFLAEFLSSRAAGIRPLFDAAQVPELQSLDKVSILQ